MSHPLFITLVIYLAGLGAAGQFSKLAVSFVTLVDVYGGNTTTLGLAVSLISLVGVVLGLAAGMVVNRIGTRRALIWALLLGAAISLWQASLPSLPFLMASRVLEGGSHLLIVVAAPTLIAEITPDRLRPAALTFWSTFFAVAFAMTAIIAPGVIAFGGLPALLLGHGVWMAAACALCLVTLPKEAAHEEFKSPEGTIFERHIRAYATAGIAAPALAWLCYTLTFVSLLTALPLLTNGTAPAWLAPLAPLVSIAVSLSAGIFLLSRVRALNVTIGGFAASLGAAGFALVADFSAISILVVFAALAFVQGSGFATVPQLNPTANARALANAAMAQSGSVGNLIGTPLLILSYNLAPGFGPFAFLAIAYVAGVGLTWGLGRKAVADLLT